MCAMAEFLIVFYDVESVVITGPIIVLIALVGIVLALRGGYGHLALLGLANILVCLLFFGLVVSLDWLPRDADTPFAIMGLVYSVLTFPIALWATRQAPQVFNPWECATCGYLLYGLTEPRCPECGEPFDPAMLNTLHR